MQSSDSLTATRVECALRVRIPVEESSNSFIAVYYDDFFAVSAEGRDLDDWSLWRKPSASADNKRFVGATTRTRAVRTHADREQLENRS
jgi:hypothetical protein